MDDSNMEPINQPQGDIIIAQQSLPNATTVLVLGILSIVFCFICGIVALLISNGDKRLYFQNPQLYSSSSYDLLRAGRICSVVSLCLWGLIIVFYIGIFVFAMSFATFND